MEKENKKKVDEKSFDVDDFYRKVGIGLLLLLVFLIIIFGTIMFVIQNKILKLTNNHFIEKSKINVISPDLNELERPILYDEEDGGKLEEDTLNLPETNLPDESGINVSTPEKKAPGLDGQDVVE